MRNSMGVSVLAATLAATPALALEKTAARVIDRDDAWNAAGTYDVRYYNTCTGWVWIWRYWDDGEQVAVDFGSTCYNPTFLVTTTQLIYSGLPSGYGFTGTIEARTPGCGGVSLDSQSWLPPVGTGWDVVSWGGLPVPSTGLEIVITWRVYPGLLNWMGLASDHPLAGPTGPTACGLCFPSTRTTHSRYYGVNGAYCPSGIALSDGLCDVEWLMEAVMACEFAVESQSWGKVKSLYR